GDAGAADRRSGEVLRTGQLGNLNRAAVHAGGVVVEDDVEVLAVLQVRGLDVDPAVEVDGDDRDAGEGNPGVSDVRVRRRRIECRIIEDCHAEGRRRELRACVR